jgi:hypothetical protein
MNYTTAVFLINPAVRAVTVSYEPSADPKVGASKTLYKTTDPDLCVGEFVVVPTNTRWKSTIGRVEEVDVDYDLESTTEVQWIISAVPMAPYEQTLKMEQDMIVKIRSAEVRKKREDLRDKLLADNDALRDLVIENGGQVPLPPPAPPTTE